MEYSAMEQYWIWLSSIEGIGAKKFYQLLSIFEDPRSVWDNIDSPEIASIGPLSAKAIKKARREDYFYKLFADLDATGVRAVPRISDDYPAMLNNIYDPPTTLFALGEADLSPERAISIVGSRRATRNGLRAAFEFAEDLAMHDVTVVSGLARGIDSQAHRGTIKAHKPTIAVLGSGPDVPYPPENTSLVQEILDNGGAIISEYPPHTKPLSCHFPARNRIISGMSQGTVLVEGDKGSGAMITMDFAAGQNRDVFAVPGCIYVSQSTMPNQLIIDGAIPVVCGMDILEHYRWASREEGVVSHERKMPDGLDAEERAIVEPLLTEEHSFDELQCITGIPVPKLNSHLTMLILRGIIVKASGGIYQISQ